MSDQPRITKIIFDELPEGERGPLMALGHHYHEIAQQKGWWDQPDRAACLNEVHAAMVSGISDLETRVAVSDIIYKRWPQRNVGELLMLMVTEIAEAYEAYRTGDFDRIYRGPGGKPEGGAVEIGDLFIRMTEMAAQRGWDLDQVVAEKSAYNEGRPYRHGGKLA